MKTSILKTQFYFPRHTILTNSTPKPPFFIPLKTISHLKHPKNANPSSISSRTIGYPTKLGPREKPQILELKPMSQRSSKIKLSQDLPNGYSRFVIFGAVSLGVVLFLMGIDDQKALAFGPEGPLVEEFWDNMRRYGLYILTVSTGVASAILEPIVELLKNPISAILIITIIVGGIYIVSQVVSAMVGVSNFAYEYGY